MYVNQRQFYKELDEPQGSDQPSDANEATEFWCNIWDLPVEHRRDAGWLNYLKEKTQVKHQTDCEIHHRRPHIVIQRRRRQRKQSLWT